MLISHYVLCRDDRENGILVSVLAKALLLMKRLNIKNFRGVVWNQPAGPIQQFFGFLFPWPRWNAIDREFKMEFDAIYIKTRLLQKSRKK